MGLEIDKYNLCILLVPRLIQRMLILIIHEYFDSLLTETSFLLPLNLIDAFRYELAFMIIIVRMYCGY